jgi:predicted patatin/cPLA2 family phospholipase
MNALLNIITIAGVTFASAAPVFAEAHMVDPVTLTCAEFSAMDSTSMMTATHSVDMAMAMTEEEMTAAMAMTDEEKTAMQAENDAAMAAMTEDETAAATAATETSMANIVTACSAMPDGTVMDAVKAGM